jgi:predicted house-cleaning noncanonical NTP pyrophosphatase (MazG superfamily)
MKWWAQEWLESKNLENLRTLLNAVNQIDYLKINFNSVFLLQYTFKRLTSC